MSIKTKRKKIMDVIVGVMDTLDPTGKNGDKYKRKLGDLSDEEFSRHVKKFFADDKANLYLEIVPFEVEPNIENIEKAANFLNIPLEEYVYMPWVYNDENGNVKTQYKALVGYINMRKVQQMISKKNSMSTSIDKRDPSTGQVVKEDKNARVSDMENFALVVLDAKETIKEFNGPRADDMNMKTELYNKISRDGYVELDSLESKVTDKTAINTLDVFFLMAGLKTNLVNSGYELPKKMLDDAKGKVKDVSTAKSKYETSRNKF